MKVASLLASGLLLSVFLLEQSKCHKTRFVCLLVRLYTFTQPFQAQTPITWYTGDGETKSLSPALDAYVYGENAYSMPHMDLKPTTWEVCDAYFQSKTPKQIDRENKYWCWILPTKIEGGEAVVVATSSVQKLRMPLPLQKGEGSTLPAVGTPPTRLFKPANQIVDPRLQGSVLPLVDGLTVVKQSASTVVDGVVSYWLGNGKGMDEDDDFY